MTAYQPVLLAVLWAVSLASAQTLDNPQVISRQVVQVGERKIIFELIVPPAPMVFPDQPGSSAPQALPRNTLSLSCTVFGNEFTEMRWRDSAGAEYLVWSSLDFTPFTNRSSGGFDLGGVHYEVMMGLGQAKAAEAAAPLSAFHTIVPPTEPGAWYAVLQQPETPTAGAFDGVNALHLWFEANKAAIIAEHDAVKAANAAQKALEAAQPQVKPDTLMRFWPVQSVLHGVHPSSNGEGQP